jgi:hypothetical protein
MNWLKKQAGFSIVEVLVAFALLGAAIFTIMEGLDYIERKKTITDKNVSMENMLSSIVDSARSNIIMEKIDFQAGDSNYTQNWLNNSTFQSVKDSLKMCWVKDGLIPLADYPNCPGRFGYAVSPLKIDTLVLRGLYYITVRMTHDELFPNSFRQYQFIVRGP